VADHAVTPTAHGYGQVFSPGKLEGGEDIGEISAANDQGGVPVNAPVPDTPSRVVVFIMWVDYFASHTSLQMLKGYIIDSFLHFFLSFLLTYQQYISSVFWGRPESVTKCVTNCEFPLIL
jgi:hypothetical protein